MRLGGAPSNLYCKLHGGCLQCQEKEAVEVYCADTGFTEELHCTTNPQLHSKWPVVITYPYPSDVHIDDDRDDDARWGPNTIRVVRGCTERTVAEHVDAFAAEVAAAAQHGGMAHMRLFHFELVMCLVLGLALPVVYWRKIRIRHL